MFYEEFADKGSFDSHCNSSYYLDVNRGTEELIENLSPPAFVL